MERIRSEFEKILTGPSLARTGAVCPGLYARMKAPFPYTGHDTKAIEAMNGIEPEHSTNRWGGRLPAAFQPRKQRSATIVDVLQ